MMPGLTTSADLLGDLDLFRERDTEVIRVRDTDEKLEVTLDTSDYKPDELKVSVQEGMVVMEGRHEEKSEDGSRQTTRQFIRRFVHSSLQ
jgi:HSP20 family molecular chaperone IbpA